MKIERIIRKDEKNVIIFLDNNENLILSEDVFFNSGLRKGDKISEDRYSFFISQNVFYHAKNRALNFLARRFHSERELYLKLKSKSYDEKIIKAVIENLKVLQFIDDKTFANHFIEEKLKKKKWGTNKIKSALFSKGVSSEIIDELLKQHFNQKENFQMAIELAQKKILILQKRNFDKRHLTQKIITFLLSRGFDYEVSSSVSRNLLKEEEDFN